MEAVMIPYQFNMKIGPTPGKTIQLTKPELSIGRDLSNDIVISDADVSRKHARLVQQGESYLLEDLGSTNGTFVNGNRLTAPQTLQSGDIVKLGEAIEMTYERPGFDAQATMLASQADILPPVPAAMPEPPAVPGPVREPAGGATVIAPEPLAGMPAPTTYVEDHPAAPQFQYEPAVPETPKKGKKTGLLIGIGCAVLLCLCVAVAAAGYFWVWPLFQG
jgi:predicted component of type VI protein secretion system